MASRGAAYFREAGVGPGVVCLHANASSSSQWRELMELLSADYRVFAPDSYGAGKSPPWHSSRKLTLGDEVRFIEPVLEMAGAPLVLVGHSYGAAIALLAAIARPQRIAALALFEPTLFSLVDARSPPPNGADGIRHTVLAASAALDAADPDGAARHFIDFWMGQGSWEATAPARKPAILASIVSLRHWAHALTTEPTPLNAFAALNVPILYMLGGASPLSARAVASCLIPVLPQVRVVEFPGLGHMAPVTHPGVINPAIAGFLAEAQDQRDEGRRRK